MVHRFYIKNYCANYNSSLRVLKMTETAFGASFSHPITQLKFKTDEWERFFFLKYRYMLISLYEKRNILLFKI